MPFVELVVGLLCLGGDSFVPDSGQLVGAGSVVRGQVQCVGDESHAVPVAVYERVPGCAHVL